MTATTRAKRRSVRTISVGVIGALLSLWMAIVVATDGVAWAALASLDAAHALALRPQWARSRTLAAEVALAHGDVGAAIDNARAALTREPLNVRALRTLGLAEERRGNPDVALALINASARLSWRDTPTQAWLLRHALLTGDTAAAIQRADALARRRQSLDLVLAVLQLLARSAEGRAALVQALADRPPWRVPFFDSLAAARPADMPGLVQLIEGLERTRAPATRAESNGLLLAMTRAGDHPAARRLWAEQQGLRADAPVPNVADGGFDRVKLQEESAQASPFDWRVEGAGSVVVDVGAPPFDPEARALAIVVEAIEGQSVARQALVLAPGPHQLSAKVAADRPGASARLRVAVSCVSGERIATTSAEGGSGAAWAPIRTAFTVPAAGCGAQSLEVVIDAGDRSERAEMWLDDIAIR